MPRHRRKALAFGLDAAMTLYNIIDAGRARLPAGVSLYFSLQYCHRTAYT